MNNQILIIQDESSLRKILREEIKSELELSLRGNDKKEKNQDLLSTEEASEYLSCTRQTIYNLIKRGELSYTKVGKLTFIKKKSLEDYIEKNTFNKVENGWDRWRNYFCWTGGELSEQLQEIKISSNEISKVEFQKLLKTLMI